MEQSTPAERLMALFATTTTGTRGKPIRRRSNGLTRFCDASGIAQSVASRWRSKAPSGMAGRIPPQYNFRIMQAVDAVGIPRSSLVGILDPGHCPKCGQLIEGEK